jgi:hypothetical protein
LDARLVFNWYFHFRLKVAVQVCALLLIFTSGVFAVLLSQASATNYRRLFWHVMPIAALHLLMAILYFRQTRRRMRWAVLALAVLVIGSFAEMTLRVWVPN